MRTYNKKNYTKKNTGFTLIEIMAAVAIIGILAAISFPAYQTYIIKTKLIEVTRFSGAAKTYIWEEYFVKAEMPETTSNAAITSEQMMLASQLISDANYNRIDQDTATLEVKFSDSGGAAESKTIIYTFLTDGETIALDCTGGTMPDIYRPTSCKSD